MPIDRRAHPNAEDDEGSVLVDAPWCVMPSTPAVS
jgi:hypothetical protein